MYPGLILSNMIGLAAAGTAPGAASGQDMAGKEMPGILIIYCDQLAAWTLGCYGGTEIKTPNIDSLAADGVIATDFFCNSPLSTPSRGCWMTGLYPSEHGAIYNHHAMHQDVPTFASELRKAGYVTGYGGKWHLDGSDEYHWGIKGNDMGWTYHQWMYSSGHPKTIRIEADSSITVSRKHVAAHAENYPTDFFAGKAIEFISKHKDKPFCYMLSIPDPHIPYSVRAPYDTLYKASEMKIPHSLLSSPESSHYFHNYTKCTDKAGKKAKNNAARLEQELPAIKARYFGMIKCIDDNVGRIVCFLKENGLYDNTVIVFSADHGDMMGEHGGLGKSVPFDGASRVPFIMRCPDRISPGTKTDRMMSSIDFFPTLLDAAGLKTKAKVSGHDMMPWLTGRKASGDGGCVFFRSYYKNYPWVAAVTKEYKLIYGEKDPDGQGLLIDRKKDPEELENRFNDPEYAEVVKSLTGKIRKYLVKHNDPHIEWFEKNVKY